MKENTSFYWMMVEQDVERVIFKLRNLQQDQITLKEIASIDAVNALAKRESDRLFEIENPAVKKQ